MSLRKEFKAWMRHKNKPPDKPPARSNEKLERNLEILSLTRAGKMQQAEIARMFGICPARVHEIVCKYDRMERWQKKHKHEYEWINE